MSSTLVNNLLNSAKQEAQSSLKLRPSVLRINDNSPTSDSSTAQQESIDQEKEETSSSTKKLKKDDDDQTLIKSTNLFKFAPLTDNKKPTGFNLGSSISASSSCAILQTSSAGTSDNKNSSSTLLTNNGDNKQTNYFTENLFQIPTQSTSNNPPELSTFSLAFSNSESAAAAEIKPITTTTGQSTGFVFGQNLQDRVTNFVVEKPKLSTFTSAEPSTSQTDNATASSSSSSTTTISNSNDNLAGASAAALTPSVPEKRKFENITGEEEETNVMHIYCKLFHWDSNQSAWKERGKGNLRLNDKYDEERSSSRLIMRTAGSFKLILNCLIISGMKFELTNDSKCLRFSNVDGIYLVKGKQMDIEQIYSLIEQRLKMLPKRRAEQKQNEEDEKFKNEMEKKLRINKDDDEDDEESGFNTSEDKKEEDSSYKSEETSINKDEDNSKNVDEI